MKQKKPSTPSVTIRELKETADWDLAFPLIRLLNKDMTRPKYKKLLAEMLPLGYRCIGAFEGKKLLGVTGFWTGTRFWCGRYIALDNVVVDKGLRSRGIGSKMVAWVEKEGKRLGYNHAELDSYVTAHDAHRFYFREGYCILGHHFTKKM